MSGRCRLKFIFYSLKERRIFRWKKKLREIRERALAEIAQADSLAKLNDVRVAYLGKKGELTAVLKGMKNVSPEDRPKVGQMVNETRTVIEEQLEAAKAAMEAEALDRRLAGGSDRM